MMRTFKLAAIAAFLGTLFLPGAAFCEYRLQPGDVLDVLITGVPDYRPHVTIGIEGDIGLPLAGQIKVGDLALPEARNKIAAELANKLYRQVANDGREISHLILNAEVVVTVSEYSPVYVNGDVTKPGAYPFRPGMTLRQAIAVAGGYSPVRLAGTDPAMQSAELQSQYNTLWGQLIGEQARAWRIRKELGEKDDQDNLAKGLSTSSGTMEQFIKGETEQLDARKASREAQKALLQEAIRKAGTQLDLLAEKKSKDEEGSQADQADFKTVRDLFQKGLAQSSRLAETRRAALMSSEQLLQTIAEISNVERQRDEYVRQLEQIDSLARVDNLQELQKSILRIAELTATLRGVKDRLALVGKLKPATDQRPDLALYRKGTPQPIVATEDLDLTPGDVVEVTLPHDNPNNLLVTQAVTH